MKTPFSELLSEIISQSEISKNEMIRACDIDRSSFFKFLNGSRIPTMEQLNTICNKLQFSPMEEKALRLEYARITRGENTVRSRDRIIAFLWKLEESDGLNEFPLSWPQLSSTRLSSEKKEAEAGKSRTLIVNGRENVLHCLADTIISESKRKKSPYEIDLFLPGQAEDLLKWLMGFTKSNAGKRAKIVQLIELPSRSLNSEQMVIDKLGFSLLCSMTNPDTYSSYYFYSNTSIDEYVGVCYPFYLITDHQVVLLNERMNKAIVLTEPECCADFRDTFMTALNRSLPIIKKVRKEDLEAELNNPIRFRYGCKQLDGRFENEETIAYISPSGIRDYYEAGGPGNSLEEIRKKIGNGIFLVDEKIIPSARTWCAASSGREKLVFCKNSCDYSYIVTESGMVEAFFSFLESLPDSGSLLRTDLAIEYADGLTTE